MKLKLEDFNLMQADQAREHIRQYLESKGLHSLEMTLSLWGKGNEVTLLDEMRELIWAAYAHGYARGERDATPYDPEDWDGDD